MKFFKNLNTEWITLILTVIICFTISNLKAQVGPLIWEDNFDAFDNTIWNEDVGDGCNIGICGWGNAELQWYLPNNVNIQPVPGEPGNNALVLEAKNQSINGYGFTSGKVTTEDKLAVHYGLIEIRAKMPDLDTGLWPALWLLGTANTVWPDKGEIDIMEMGHKQSFRANQGFPNSDVNSYVSANAIFTNADGSFGSISWDTNFNTPYLASTPMNDRFVKYRLYWEPTQMRFALEDNGVEYDLYAAPLPFNANGPLSEFTQPFYLLMNLAVGGNLTDATTNTQMTAPLPAKMYIDYVRIYEYNGHGSVETDYAALQPESGTFGVYTENTTTTGELSFGLDSEIYVWEGTLQTNNNCVAPDGSEVIGWSNTMANNWFGGGIASSNGRNMSNYLPNGVLKFDIKIPADISFRIGITDNYTNESWITFPAFQTQYGLVRDGNWGEVTIPLIDFAGIIAFQDIFYMFAISSDVNNLPSYIFDMCIDDIVWEETAQNCNLNLSINGLPATVSSNSPVSLSGTPAGGIFSGSGIVFNAFNPGIAGPGFHTITYTYDDGNGCSVSTSQDVFVFNITYVFVNYNLGIVAPKIMNDSELVVTSKSTSNYHLNIYDVNGRTLFGQKLTTQPGVQNTGIRPFKNLNKGVYIFTINDGEKRLSEKVYVD